MVITGKRSGPSAPSERDTLLATKFAIPQVRPGVLRRARLTEALDAGVARDLVLIATPAGFGKTTLVADWARSTNAPVAWLSLDEDDNDPVRFWRYVIEALDGVVGGLGDRLVSLRAGLSVRATRGAVRALANELETAPQRVTLVIDDYHVIESPSIHEDMAILTAHPSPNLHLVLTSRADPPLPLARLRARGQLLELRAPDLRFTPEESTAFMHEVWGLALSPEAMAGLEARTEGWAVGLQLAALSLRQRPDADAFLARFAGTHRFVLDYLSQEVLQRVPDEIRNFLLRTSILDRLSAPLCDAVSGRSDGQRMLEAIEQASLFLVPLDDERRWWRYHHLFADVLRSRLAATYPEEVEGLHQRAAQWCQHHGLVDDAVHHAVLGGDLQRAATLVERHVEELLLRRSERATLDRWSAALPRDVLASRPRLLLAQSIAAQLELRADDAAGFLAAAERAPAELEEPHDASVGREASVLSNAPAAMAVIRAEMARLHGEADAAAGFADQAYERLRPEDWLLATFVRYHRAMADWLRGRIDRAERGLEQVVQERRIAGERYLAVRAAFDLGSVRQAAGRLGAALRTYRRALDIITEPGRPLRSEAGLALVGMAEVLRERGETEAAFQAAIDGVERCRRVVYPLPLVSGLVTLARVRVAMGDRDAAMTALDEAEHVVPDPHIVSLLNSAPAERCRLWLLDGRLEPVHLWTIERGLTDDDEPAYPREPEYLVLARLRLAQGESERAVQLLDRLEGLAQSQERFGSLIRIRGLRALALQAAGDPRGASSLLADALALARAEGYLRVFADEGPRMAALVQSLVRAWSRSPHRGVPAGDVRYLNRLIRTFRAEAVPEEPRTHAGELIEPLTSRELEVLTLIAAGRRNQEIADELVVTLDTVKRHVSHINQKLGAGNRTEAVARARDLQLIS